MIADAAIVDPGGTVEIECLALVDQKWLAESFYILKRQSSLASDQIEASAASSPRPLAKCNASLNSIRLRRIGRPVRRAVSLPRD